MSNMNQELINNVNKLIGDTYYDDIQKCINGRSWWQYVANVTETLGKICTGIATIIAFASGFFGASILPFIAGCFGTLSLVLLQFSTYATNESRERTVQTNKILQELGIRKLVDISIEPAPNENQEIKEV